jgi:glutamate carboxypeptidase
LHRRSSRCARSASKEKPPLLDTLKALVSIESGSRDVEGLSRSPISCRRRLRELGGEVALVEPRNCLQDGGHARAASARWCARPFTGTGSKKILLIAHMDTVYQRGMLEKQPFRIDGDRAYGSASPTTSRASR